MGKKKDKARDRASEGDLEIFYPSKKPILKDCLQAEYVKTLAVENEKILAYMKDKDYNTALKHLKKIYRKTEEALGSCHKATLDILSKTGLIYRLTNRFDLAIGVFRKIYFQRLVSIGPRHSDTLTSIRSIAGLLKEQGRYELAYEIHNDLKDGVMLQIKMAEALQKEHEYDAALKIFKKIYAKTCDTLGTGHPNTQSCIHYIAKVLIAQEKFEEAFEIYEKLPNEEIKYMVQCLMIADIYKKSHQTLSLYAKLFAKTLKTYGPNYIDILSHKHFYIKLAKDNSKSNKTSETEFIEGSFEMVDFLNYLSFLIVELISDSLQKYRMMAVDKGIEHLQSFHKQVEKHLGPYHNQTLYVLYHLGSKLEACDRHEEAFKVFKKIMESRLEFLHKFSNSDLKVIQYFTKILPRIANPEQEIEFFSFFFQKVRTALGPCHDYSLSVQFILACAFYKLKMYCPALFFYDDLLVKQTRSSEKGLKAIQTKTHIILVYANLRRFHECKKILEEVLEKCRELQINTDDIGLDKLRKIIEREINSIGERAQINSIGERAQNNSTGESEEMVPVKVRTKQRTTEESAEININADNMFGIDKNIEILKIQDNRIRNTDKLPLIEKNKLEKNVKEIVDIDMASNVDESQSDEKDDRIQTEIDEMNMIFEKEKNIINRNTFIKKDEQFSETNETMVKIVEEQDNLKDGTSATSASSETDRISIDIKSFKFLKSRAEEQLRELLMKFNEGNTPLHYAIRSGSSETVKFLLAKGAIPRANSYGFTPLHYATYSGDVKIVEILLEHVKLTNESNLKHFINFKNTFDCKTALHIASHKNYLDIVWLLLKYDADINLKSRL